MIGFMPVLYPDEILYSWIARYHRYSGNKRQHTISELFGSLQHQIRVDLPRNLEKFHANISRFGDCSLEELIENHTLIRYYCAIESPDNPYKETLKERMIRSGRVGRLETGNLFAMRREFALKGFFHYCHKCAKEDLEIRGETYWRTSHQIFGVYVCTKHRVLLSSSRVPFKTREYVAAVGEDLLSENTQFLTTERPFLRLDNDFWDMYDNNLRNGAEPTREMIKVKIDSNLFTKLLWISQKIEQILRDGYYIYPSGHFTNYYWYTLQHCEDKMRIKEFGSDPGIISKFIELYGEPFLKLLLINYEEHERPKWFSQVLNGVIKHPIHHILMKKFIDISMPRILPFDNEELIQTIKEIRFIDIGL